MEESEKERLRKAKADAVAYLQGLEMGRYRYALEDTDQRLRVYVDEVTGNPEAHNLFEVLAVKRFFYLLDRYEWDAKAAQKFIKFYEICKFSGKKGRQSYKLVGFQVFQFSNIYGFRRADGHRLIRDAIIFIPRKASKTTSSASMAVYDLLFGDANSEAYVGANNYKQSSIAFKEIKGILKGFDPRMKYFKITRERIECLIKDRSSVAECLTSNANTKDGLNASLVIMDEYSQARNTKGKKGSELKNVLVSSMGNRTEPLTVTITTASDVLDGPFVEELDFVKRVLLGDAVDDSVFALLFQPDVDDTDLADPQLWRKVQPMLGLSVEPDYYAEYWQRAQRSSDDMLTFKTKQLNIFATDERMSWLSLEKAQELCARPVRFEELRSRPDAMVSFDLSVKDDFSAVSFMWYDSAAKVFCTNVRYYFPEGQLSRHPNETLYRLWAERGFLTLCPGDKIDVNMVAEDIMRAGRFLNIRRIGYDAYKARDLVNIISSTGGKAYLSPVSQTYGNFNMPLETFEMMAFNTPPQIVIDNNPINIYCAVNAVCDEDRLGNRKIIKRTPMQKIDGMVCVLMCVYLFSTAER